MPDYDLSFHLYMSTDYITLRYILILAPGFKRTTTYPHVSERISPAHRTRLTELCVVLQTVEAATSQCV